VAFLLPVLAGACVLGAVCAVVEALARAGPLAGERGRKAVHIGGGAITAALPWWLDAGQVVVLAGLMLGAFLVSRRRRLVRCIHGGPQRGHGELVFCVAVAIVAATAGVGPAFVAAVLTLALADPAAALAGHRAGRHPLPGPLRAKSWEGSAACLLVAGAVNALVLLGAPSRGSITDWLAVPVLAVLAALAEAVPHPGWDNLAIPVAVGAGWALLVGA
jgi:dolichol kinase